MDGNTGFLAEYFPSSDLSGKPQLTRNDKLVDFHGRLEWTIPAIGAKAARWTTRFIAPADGTYRVGIIGLSPYRLIIDGHTFVDVWQKGSEDPGSIGAVQMRLKAGQAVPIVIEGRTVEDMLDLTFLWDRADIDPSPQILSRLKDADAILFAGGLDGCMEAEETDIRGLFQGFIKGDRSQIELPSCQSSLMKSLATLHKPLIFINMTGSAIAMPWEAQREGPVQAILQAWYPGEAGGRAIADVVFGSYNPSGRLPITFYQSTGDLPAFTDYAMPATTSTMGRTYRYFHGEPLWRFGHGLSYTQYGYAAATLSKAEMSGDTLEQFTTLSIDISNKGAISGDEVVQVYVVAPDQGEMRERLAGFSRVHVDSGATVHVQIPISLNSLRIWEPSSKQYVLNKGPYTLNVGPDSATARQSCVLVIK
jgi:beta-glucosidase